MWACSKFKVGGRKVVEVAVVFQRNCRTVQFIYPEEAEIRADQRWQAFQLYSEHRCQLNSSFSVPINMTVSSVHSTAGQKLTLSQLDFDS